jgi:hypothetical protein
MSARCKCGQRIVEPARCLSGHAQPGRPPLPVSALAKEIARELAPLLAAELRAEAAPATAAEPTGLVKPKQLAHMIGMSPRFVYDHQDELAVIRMGTGPKPPLRFDRDRSLARFAELRDQGVLKAPPKLEQRELPEGAPLLPVRSRAA